MSPPRQTTDVTNRWDLIAEALAELRGENRQAHHDIDEHLRRLDANLDGSIVMGRQHGQQIAMAAAVCEQRHRRDSDEVRKLESIDKRLASLETTGVTKQAAWKQVGAWIVIAFTAAGGVAGLLQFWHK